MHQRRSLRASPHLQTLLKEACKSCATQPVLVGSAATGMCYRARFGPSHKAIPPALDALMIALSTFLKRRLSTACVDIYADRSHFTGGLEPKITTSGSVVRMVYGTSRMTTRVTRSTRRVSRIYTENWLLVDFWKVKYRVSRTLEDAGMHIVVTLA